MERNSVHVAIIMDGNGRWANARGLPRIAGHREGAKSVRTVVESAPELGVTDLTLYAFSSDNWRRPASETGALMEMFDRYLRKETAGCVKEGIRMTVIGRRDRLPEGLVRRIADSERVTRAGRNLHLRIAIDYSSRDAIAAALEQAPAGTPSGRDGVLRGLGIPDVDLLIRTGGEQRLSDFLLWECAYAELYFTPSMWPEFGRAELGAALEWFGARDRRFGGVKVSAA
jgi:undecaprenyl diphosphate synthase